MTIEIQVPRAIEKQAKSIQKFFQWQVNRLAFGQYRYGDPRKDQNYLTRAIMEMRAYKKNGNLEYLLNISNYCWLESEAPENKRFHYDPSVDSVTRGHL